MGLNLHLRTLKSKMSVLLKLMYQLQETPQDGNKLFYSIFFYSSFIVVLFLKKSSNVKIKIQEQLGGHQKERVMKKY